MCVILWWGKDGCQGEEGSHHRLSGFSMYASPKCNFIMNYFYVVKCFTLQLTNEMTEAERVHSISKNIRIWRLYSGKSTQWQFWRKWAIDVFEVVIGQQTFWQNFGQFGPFPVGVLQRSSMRVKISKCFKWPFMYSSAQFSGMRSRLKVGAPLKSRVLKYFKSYTSKSTKYSYKKSHKWHQNSIHYLR